MLKYWSYDIVCQEIPDEITLAVNITGCPNRCLGCHSPWLWDDVGIPLTPRGLEGIMATYLRAITCVCFMGGDADPKEVEVLAGTVKKINPSLKTAWYSGRQKIEKNIDLLKFNFIKLGPYIKSLGGLREQGTNQQLYRILPTGQMEKISFSNRPRLPL